MACDCIRATNRDLAEHNTRLGETIVCPRDGSPGYTAVTLVVEKIAPRGRRAVVMLPTCCPFCGVRYEAAEEAPATAAGEPAVPSARDVLQAAAHALRSYQHGNAAPDLAMSVADACDAALAEGR